MRPYEIAVIFTLDADEAAVGKVLDRVQATYESAGGKTQKVNRVGRRQFAYEINHMREGNYVYVNANFEPSSVAETDRVLTLADEVIRHKILRVPEGEVRTSALVSDKAPEFREFKRDKRDRDRDR